MASIRNAAFCLCVSTCLFQMGCVSILAQTVGKTADIQGQVVMPDGTPAKEVVLHVSYSRIDMRLGSAWGSGKDFDEVIHSKDGKFHLRYLDVVDVFFTAEKPGWRSFSFAFSDDLRVSGLVVQLHPAGEFRDLSKLHDAELEIYDMQPATRSIGIRIGQPRQGPIRKFFPLEDADFVFERITEKGDDGIQKPERLVFKVGKEMGLHRVIPPKEKHAEILLEDLTLAPEGPYDTTEIALDPYPLGKEPVPISGYFRTADGKYGAFRISRWEALKTRSGDLLWRISFRYLLNPDGTRHLNTLKFMEFDEKKLPKR